MKKSLFTAAGLMSLALAFSSCQKEPVETLPAVSEPNFELFAQPASTKTTNDGLDTKWAAGDAINVFHAAAGSTTYVNDGQFSLKDTGTGKFDGTVTGLDADASYDWYAFYPYVSQIVTPANTSKGWATVGGVTQTQSGNNSMAHLAGKACPLYGVAAGVASNETPSISMNHLASVIKVNVTNTSGEALTVSSVAFTGTEDIAGTYYINFAASPVAYKSSGNNYVSKTATLTVNGGEAIANGSSAAFYIALKPFTAKSGSTLKLSVNGYEKTLPLPSDVIFTAGHIKTLGFKFDTTDKTAFFNFADPESLGIAKPATGKGTNITDPIVKSDITITATNGSTETRIWNNSGKCDLRVYTKGTLKFSAADGFKISSISFNGSVADTKVSCDAGTYKSNNWTGEVQSVTFTASSTINITSATVTYKKGVILPALATPTVDFEIQNLNSIYVMWSEVDGAKDYTVTCGDETVTVTGDEYTFDGLAYSTEYTISVVANPSDDTVNAKSAPGTATVTTGANPSGEATMYTIVFKTATSDGSTEIGSSTKSSTVVSDGADYISSFSSKCSKAYYNGKNGVKLGANKSAGTFEFNLADAVSSNIVSIKVISAKYSSDTGTITFSADGSELKTGINPGEDYTHSFSTPTNVKTLSFKTSTKRAYISKIVISVSSK